MNWEEGGLYWFQSGPDRFQVLKLLKLDDHGVHVRVYSNTFAAPPVRIDEQTLFLGGVDPEAGGALGMGHLPVSLESFRGWQATFVQPSRVAPEELEGYELWQEARGGYF